MKRTDAIADRLRRTLAGPMWHGDAVNELLHGVSAAEAVEHPVQGAHSIWELVIHMTAWANIARDRLSFRPTPTPTDAEDWPPVGSDTSSVAWTDAIAKLHEAYEQLAQAAQQLDESKLKEMIPGHGYTAHVMLSGVVEHGCYHGGQIAILKRALHLKP